MALLLLVPFLWANVIKTEEFHRPDDKIHVAIIDTGVDISHPAFKGKIWTNKKEILGNGIDDDKNGFVDDIHGWDFIKKSGNMEDLVGHGTHIAGLVLKNTSNVEISVYNYFSKEKEGHDFVKLTADAIRLAIKNGADIINYSSAGADFSKEEEEAIKEAAKKGIIFLVAAGNTGKNDNTFPCAYKVENIICVGSSNLEGNLLPSSSYSSHVYVLTYGGEITSSIPSGSFGTLKGSSQATALITNFLVKNLKKKDLSVKSAKSLIDERTSPVINKGHSFRFLNLERAISSIIPKD